MNIEEVALNLVPRSLACFGGIEFDANQAERDMFIKGAKHESSRDYWYSDYNKLLEENKRLQSLLNDRLPNGGMVSQEAKHSMQPTLENDKT